MKFVNQDKLMNSILSFIDRNGEVKGRHGTPLSGELQMTFKRGNIDMFMNVLEHVFSNGNCFARVKVAGKVVYDGEGNYIAGARNVVAKTYKPGAWEKLLAEKKSLAEKNSKSYTVSPSVAKTLAKKLRTSGHKKLADHVMSLAKEAKR